MTTVGPWVQPDDATIDVNLTYIGYADHGLAFDGEFANNQTATPGTVGAPAAAFITYEAGDVRHLAASVLAFDLNDQTYPRVHPSSLPPNALDYEFEYGVPTGIPTDDPIRIAGTLLNDVVTGDDGAPETQYTGELRGFSTNGYTIDGALSPPFRLDPDGFASAGISAYLVGDLYGGSVLATLAPPAQPGAPGGFAESSLDVDVDLGQPDSAGWITALLRFPASFGTVSAITSLNYQQAFGFNPFSVVARVTYQPVRYRFIFAGRTPIRGRQRASGVMGSIPLRGRQGDVWGLRGRQNSNL